MSSRVMRAKRTNDMPPRIVTVNNNYWASKYIHEAHKIRAQKGMQANNGGVIQNKGCYKSGISQVKPKSGSF
jgi:hypothetical protein